MDQEIEHDVVVDKPHLKEGIHDGCDNGDLMDEGEGTNKNFHSLFRLSRQWICIYITLSQNWLMHNVLSVLC